MQGYFVKKVDFLVSKHQAAFPRQPVCRWMITRAADKAHVIASPLAKKPEGAITCEYNIHITGLQVAVDSKINAKQDVQ